MNDDELLRWRRKKDTNNNFTTLNLNLTGDKWGSPLVKLHYVIKALEQTSSHETPSLLRERENIIPHFSPINHPVLASSQMSRRCIPFPRGDSASEEESFQKQRKRERKNENQHKKCEAGLLLWPVGKKCKLKITTYQQQTNNS